MVISLEELEDLEIIVPNESGIHSFTYLVDLYTIDIGYDKTVN
jgi:hypothetical protein